MAVDNGTANQMKWIKGNAPKYDSFYFEIKRLEFFSQDDATVAGTGHINSDTTYSIHQPSNISTKRKDIWKAIVSHASGFERVR